MKNTTNFITIKYRNCPICNNNTGKFIITFSDINLLRCNNCNFVFADTKQTEVLEQNVYNIDVFYSYLQKEHLVTSAYYDDLIFRIKKHFKYKKIKLLEFGCGTGQFLLRSRKYDIDSYGSDFSPYAELAKKYFDLDIEICNISETKFKPEFFDVIISHATYEHIYDIKDISLKLNTLLKPNGLFIISGVPNFALLSRRFFNNYYINTPPGHINYFEKKTMKYFFNTLNLKTLTIKSYGLDVWYVKNVLGLNKTSKNETITKNENIIKDFKNTENNIKTKHKILAKLYFYYGAILPGKSLEAWAEKK